MQSIVDPDLKEDVSLVLVEAAGTLERTFDGVDGAVAEAAASLASSLLAIDLEAPAQDDIRSLAESLEAFGQEAEVCDYQT